MKKKEKLTKVGLTILVILIWAGSYLRIFFQDWLVGVFGTLLLAVLLKFIWHGSPVFIVEEDDDGKEVSRWYWGAAEQKEN
ncbi:hypothetical protein HN954_00615 [bacterium]|jgi:hypothetical protein|nr:hypothetical protein [bacterium]MBT6832372.1 hypothetical protein [bacterium]MBT6995917.1 hypothetical protein [bacterium]MBT7772778.1 hypothetical protein [bacterium]